MAEQCDRSQSGVTASSSSTISGSASRVQGGRPPCYDASLKFGITMLVAAMLALVTLSLAHVLRWEPTGYAGVDCAGVLAILGGTLKKDAPSARKRFLLIVGIPALSLFVVILPLWSRMIISSSACYHTWASITNLVLLSLLVPIGMACASAWHPPSSYARVGPLCVLMIWVGQLGVTLYVVDSCAQMKSTTYIISSSLSLTGLGQMFTLTVLRMKAFQHSMSCSPSRLLRCLVGVLSISLLLCHPIGGYAPAIWRLAALIFLPSLLLITFLSVRAFMVPLRVLRTESSRLPGVPKKLAEWGANALCRELTGLLIQTLTSILWVSVPLAAMERHLDYHGVEILIGLEMRLGLQLRLGLRSCAAFSRDVAHLHCRLLRLVMAHALHKCLPTAGAAKWVGLRK